jgi:hypothetical protein
MSPIRSRPAAVFAAFAIVVAACGDDDDEDENPGAQFTLTFTGEGGASNQAFNGDHAGQSISVAVVRADNGAVVARESGRIGALGADPAFRFTFPGILAPGVAYHVDYWVDNFPFGAPDGRCDPVTFPLEPGESTDFFDHSWREELGIVNGDVDRPVVHSADYAPEVCGGTR